MHTTGTKTPLKFGRIAEFPSILKVRQNLFENAEKYMKQAVELMPLDPIVNDHYGDILWMLDRKIQAIYFWENVMNLEESEDDMKKNVSKKLLKGPKGT